MSPVLSPYNLPVIESCFGCPSREDCVFCHLPQSALSHLNSIRQMSVYPRGAVLFVEGESPRGLFILCSGQARLTANSGDGKSITLRLVKRGEVLGLSSVVANTPFRASAETSRPSQVSFIPRLQFLQLLRASPDAAMGAAKHLSMELHKAWDQTRHMPVASAESRYGVSHMPCRLEFHRTLCLPCCGI